MASCIHFSTPGCISLWYICPLTEPASPWHSIRRNLTAFSSFFLPLRSPLKEGSSRDRVWGIHEGQGGRGGGDHRGSTTKVRVHTGKQKDFFLIHSSVIAHTLFGLVLALFFPTRSRLGTQRQNEGVMWLVLIGPSWAGGRGGTGNWAVCSCCLWGAVQDPVWLCLKKPSQSPPRISVASVNTWRIGQSHDAMIQEPFVSKKFTFCHFYILQLADAGLWKREKDCSWLFTHSPYCRL